ncbi:MAG: DUF4255 domain-containing protein [Chloroflexi bacterium]|nr:DUF4255 domain-containing protein [Chloroflexota bacterium]
MGSYQAVAAVTAVLDYLISDAVAQLDVGATAVKVEPPKDRRNDPHGDQPAVHIYLYRVIENGLWRNNDLPLRGSQGQLVQQPRLALNLHYLISFYGKEADYAPQKLLGAVASLFQRQPILTSTLLADMKNRAAEAGNHAFSQLLQASHLETDAQVEQVKFSLVTLDLEEMSKLWSVLLQVPYTLSLTYEAAVVFIEPEVTPVEAQPVRSVTSGSTWQEEVDHERLG